MITELRRRSAPRGLARLGLAACLLVAGLALAIVVVGVWLIAFALRPQ